MEKPGEHAVEDDPGELDNFRREMNEIHNALAPDPRFEFLLMLAGSTIQASAGYNQRIAATIDKQRGEFRQSSRVLEDGLVI